MIRIPNATYRLQLHADFDFARARGLVEYLDKLGISDVYVAPILMARPGSQHGYDVVDHSQINPELGGMPEFLHFSDALIARKMGLIVDTVPNHMCGNRSPPVFRTSQVHRSYAPWPQAIPDSRSSMISKPPLRAI
jgi:maltooligosyltrehalose synthase